MFPHSSNSIVEEISSFKNNLSELENSSSGTNGLLKLFLNFLGITYLMVKQQCR